MLEINLSKICKSYNGKKVLDNFSLELKTGEHIALIGPNGSGKTTTFNIILGESIDSGNVSLRKGARIGVLTQIPKLSESDETGYDVLTRGLKEINELEKEIEELLIKIENSPEKDKVKLINELTHKQEVYSSNDGYKKEEKINKIKKHFKLSDDLLNRKFNVLSGGEKTIISLASLVLGNYDILLLDEPTNHLDIDTLEWLEGFFKNYKGSILISSHDRYFLDKVVNKVIAINDGVSETYDGNYSYYLKESERRELKLFEEYKTQARQIEAMEKAIKRLKEWGSRSDNPAFFRRARAIQKRLDKIEVIKLKEEKKELPLEFKLKERSGNAVLKIKDLDLKIEDKTLVKNVECFIGFGERVGILGKNGVGKTTLIKEILKGKNDCIKLGKNIILGFIPQEIRFDNDGLTIYEFARTFYEGPEAKLRSDLFRFYFTEDVLTKKIGVLSGGEKVRLKLFELITKNANFLILDEPTNHIDVDTREILESALLDYHGSLLFVSHDRYFVKKIATKLFVIEDESLKEFNYTYEEYQNMLQSIYEKQIEKEKEKEITLNVPRSIKEFVSNARVYDISGYSKVKVYKLVKKNITYYLKISKNDLSREKDILKYLDGKLLVPKVMGYTFEDNKHYLVTKELNGVLLNSMTDKELMFNVIKDAYMSIYLCDVEGFPYKEETGVLSHGEFTFDNILVYKNSFNGFLSLKNMSIRNERYDLDTIEKEIEKYLGKEYIGKFYEDLGI